MEIHPHILSSCQLHSETFYLIGMYEAKMNVFWFDWFFLHLNIMFPRKSSPHGLRGPFSINLTWLPFISKTFIPRWSSNFAPTRSITMILVVIWSSTLDCCFNQTKLSALKFSLLVWALHGLRVVSPHPPNLRNSCICLEHHDFMWFCGEPRQACWRHKELQGSCLALQTAVWRFSSMSEGRVALMDAVNLGN